MNSAKKIVGSTLLLMISACMILPFLYMVITSLRITHSEYVIDLSLDGFTIENYKNVLQRYSFLKFFINTIIIATSGVILNVTFSSLAGYAFAKKEFKGSSALFFFMISTLIIPSQVIMTPLYLIMRELDWINTFKGLILPLPTAFGVFLMRQAILGIPDELLESARMDGASELTIFTQIVLPLIKAPIIALTIFTFIGAWNEFMWPLIMTTDDTVRTLTVGLSTMGAQYNPNFGQIMAATTLTFLPSFILYLILQKKFVEGITLTGMKG